jgi:type I restriction enzyme M protein
MVENLSKAEEAALREPLEILDAIAALNAESAEILAGIESKSHIYTSVK